MEDDRVFIEATLDEDGRVQVPPEALERLDVQPGDRIRFVLDASVLWLQPTVWTLNNLQGAIIPRRQPLDIDRLIDEAKQAKAEDTVRKMREGKM